MNQREDEREGWPVKPYYKRDLAVAYAPDITPVADLTVCRHGASPQGALPCFGGFGLYRPAADVQFGTGGADFPVFGKAVGTDPVSVCWHPRMVGNADVCMSLHVYTCSLTHIYAQPPHIRSHEAMHTFVWTAFIPRGIPLRFRALHSVRRDGGCNTRFPCGKAPGRVPSACLCA